MGGVRSRRGKVGRGEGRGGRGEGKGGEEEGEERKVVRGTVGKREVLTSQRTSIHVHVLLVVHVHVHVVEI